jgi:hypothetical protein
MRVTENTYRGPGASLMKPGMSSRELNEIHRSVRGLAPEDNIRQLLSMPEDPPPPVQATGGGPQPFLYERYTLPSGRSGTRRAPNPAYGEQFGLEWDGKDWVKKDPNADLVRQAMEMELEARRQEMDMQRQKFAQESGVTPDLKSWLANRLGSKR